MRGLLGPQRAAELRTIPVFRDRPDDELALVEELVDDIEVEAGEVVQPGGGEGGGSFTIAAGEALAVGPGLPIAVRLRPGETFGALAGEAVLRTATVTAATPMRLLVLDPERVEELAEIGGLAARILRCPPP